MTCRDCLVDIICSKACDNLIQYIEKNKLKVLKDLVIKSKCPLCGNNVKKQSIHNYNLLVIRVRSCCKSNHEIELNMLHVEINKYNVFIYFKKFGKSFLLSEFKSTQTHNVDLVFKDFEEALKNKK